MTDDKKTASPKSEFNETSGQPGEDKAKYGVMILVSEDFNELMILNKFNYNGKEVGANEAQMRMIVSSAQRHLDMVDTSKCVMDSLISGKINVKTISGVQQMPTVEYLSKLIAQSIMQNAKANQEKRKIFMPN